MTTLQAILLGIVEGVTEFLPISSTGHLILTSRLFGILDSDFTKSFEIAIQFGAILAVVVLYFKKIVSDKEMWKKVLIAFLPTAFFGFLFYNILKQFLLSNLLAVPTMAAATAFDLYKNAGSFSFSDFNALAVGFVVSFIVAIISIKWLLHFVKNNTFISFGIYRIIIAVLFWLLAVR